MKFQGANSRNIEKVKEGVWAELEMNDLGELQYFLGIQVLRNRGKRQFHINPNGYINCILERFEMENGKPALTSIKRGTTLYKQLMAMF